MEKLYNLLQNIEETFQDTVPIEHTELPVIRYNLTNSVPSNRGDDSFTGFSHFYQVDLYDRTLNQETKKELIEMFKENFIEIQNIQDSEEADLKRIIFDIKIEE